MTGIKTPDKGTILRMILTEMAREGYRYVPAGISVRHLHVSEDDLHALFGAGYQLHPLRGLIQPGQYAAEETVTFEGPKGRLEHVRIIGPVRAESQAELSLTDAIAIGLPEIPVRMSGDLKGTPGIRVTGPAGTITLQQGAIVAKRHLHLNEEQTRAFQVHDGQEVSVRVAGERSCILEHVICRCGKGHEMELHLDTDEANACRIQSGDFLQILLPGEEMCEEKDKTFDSCRIAGKVLTALTGQQRSFAVYSCMETETPRKQGNKTILDLVTEQDINTAYSQGTKAVYCSSRAIITPAADDRSKTLQIEIIRTKEDHIENSPEPGSDTPVLELVTAEDLNRAFRDDRTEIFCSTKALITPAAMERIAETGIRVQRVRSGEGE